MKKQFTNCLKKRKYATTDKAKVTIRKVYLKEANILSVYECPICLDFHLTKLNRQAILTHQELKKEFRKEALKVWFPHWSRKHGDTIMHEAIKQMHVQLGLEKLTIKLTGTKKENSLSLGKQKEIFNALNT